MRHYLSLLLRYSSFSSVVSYSLWYSSNLFKRSNKVKKSLKWEYITISDTLNITLWFIVEDLMKKGILVAYKKTNAYREIKKISSIRVLRLAAYFSYQLRYCVSLTNFTIYYFEKHTVL